MGTIMADVHSNGIRCRLDGPFFQAARQETRSAQAERQAGGGRSGRAHACFGARRGRAGAGPARLRAAARGAGRRHLHDRREPHRMVARAQRVDRGRAGEPGPVRRARERRAALRRAGRRSRARDLLEKGVQDDPDAKASPLAWLALFDLLQRANDRAAFDQLALQYVMQFERSPPPWEQRAMAPVAAPKATPGGYVLLTGKLTSATAPQLEALRRAIDKHPTNARLDFASVAGFDDAGAQAAGRSARVCAQAALRADAPADGEDARGARHPAAPRTRSGRGAVAARARTAAVRPEAGAVRRARDRVRDRVRAVAAVVGAAARAARATPRAVERRGERGRRRRRIAESRARRLERRADRLGDAAASRRSPSMRTTTRSCRST